MAKQTRDGAESGFDFSKFIDLGDDDSALEPSTDTGGFDYNTIPHSRDEIVTGGLDRDLEAVVEDYIRAGKVSRGEKKSLRRLAADNRRLEAALRDIDAAILERADDYHAIVSNILREKNDLEAFALDDQDPYDTDVVGVDDESLGSRTARIQSTDLFGEISRLEAERAKLNDERTVLLKEILESSAKQENSGLGSLEDVIEERLNAINNIQDITKVKFTKEEEELFDQSVEDFTEYIHGGFDPLAEEDEYGDADSLEEEEPLSDDGHSSEEITAMEKASSQAADAISFGSFFGNEPDVPSFDDTSASIDEADALEEEEITEDDLELAALKTAENEGLPVVQTSSIATAVEASEEPTIEAEVSSVDEVEKEETADSEEFTPVEPYAAVSVDTEPISMEYLLEEGLVADSLSGDLSADVSEPEGNITELYSLAEDPSWDEGDADENLPYTDFLDGPVPTYSEPAEDSEVPATLEEDDADLLFEDSIENTTQNELSEDNRSDVQPVESSASEYSPLDSFEDDLTDEPSFSYSSDIDSDFISDLTENELDSFAHNTAPVRAVIFEELKEKYGISFSFESDSDPKE